MTYMMIVRIDESNQPTGITKDSPVAVFLVIREEHDSGNNGNDGDGNGTDGGGTGGNGSGAGPGNPGQSDPGDGNPSVTIGEDETPLEEYTGPRSRYFDDVPEEQWPWAVYEIDDLFEDGVVNGTAPRIFSPEANITRGDFMLMLVRAYDLVAETGGNFPDVPQGSYYYDAIAIARTLGIAKGDGENFHPQSFITRQDMMVLIDRTLRTISAPLPTAPQSVLLSFSDNDRIADYALDAVAALVQSEIIKGDGTGINPLGNTTRAEMAVVVHRILEGV